MLLHFSLAARDPERAASVLAELLGATVIRSPSPPFPRGASYVCLGDDRGTMVEVLPAGHALVPGPGASPRVSAIPPPPASASHALLLAAVDRATIEAVAAREGWPCGFVDTGLFQVLALWIDGTQLVELVTKELLPSYVKTFGAAGVKTLDAELRAVEAHLTVAQKSVTASLSGTCQSAGRED